MKFLRFLIVLNVLLGISLSANAQMSDEAVKNYVKMGLDSGKSQQDIAKELAARGVTREQAERIKNHEEGRTIIRLSIKSVYRKESAGWTPG